MAFSVSEQTVARRYRRLSDFNIVRVVGIANAWDSEESFFLRVRTQIGAARPIGTALARRSDASSPDGPAVDHDRTLLRDAGRA